jgi:hypothetical protein
VTRTEDGLELERDGRDYVQQLGRAGERARVMAAYTAFETLE